MLVWWSEGIAVGWIGLDWIGLGARLVIIDDDTETWLWAPYWMLNYYLSPPLTKDVQAVDAGEVVKKAKLLTLLADVDHDEYCIIISSLYYFLALTPPIEC
jgi:hypothetical protein